MWPEVLQNSDICLQISFFNASLSGRILLPITRHTVEETTSFLGRISSSRRLPAIQQDVNKRQYLAGARGLEFLEAANSEFFDQMSQQEKSPPCFTRRAPLFARHAPLLHKTCPSPPPYRQVPFDCRYCWCSVEQAVQVDWGCWLHTIQKDRSSCAKHAYYCWLHG